MMAALNVSHPTDAPSKVRWNYAIGTPDTKVELYPIWDL